MALVRKLCQTVRVSVTLSEKNETMSDVVWGKKLSGVEWSGVEWSGAEWSRGVE